MAKKEDEIKLTKDNARLIPQIINIDEDCTMTVVDNDLNNVGTVVVKGKKISLYTDEGNVTKTCSERCKVFSLVYE